MPLGGLSWSLACMELTRLAEMSYRATAVYTYQHVLAGQLQHTSQQLARQQLAILCFFMHPALDE